MQTSLTDPVTKHGGNCLAACLASVLECPIESVPDLTGPEFAGDSPTRHTWLQVVDDWLRAEHSCTMVDLRARIGATDRVEPCLLPGIFYLGSGPSKRGPWTHGVVMENGRVVHDPHPDQDFSNDGITEITLLVKVPAPRMSHVDTEGLPLDYSSLPDHPDNLPTPSRMGMTGEAG